MSGGTAPVLVAGEWRASQGSQVFTPIDPETGAGLGEFPISPWGEIEAALSSAARIVGELAHRPPHPDQIAGMLEATAAGIEAAAGQIVEMAHRETALPATPRLADVELPRTTDQLRQAAAAARSRTWKRPVLSPGARIASLHEPIPGVVCVFGPNNFPLAFNSIAGGDFAAAVATGHPVIGKANPGHPNTTRLLTDIAHRSALEVGLPAGFIQMIYRTDHADGARLVADPRVAATAYTGSRAGGLALKAAADAAGRPIYLEMSSVNPVIVLPGAWRERGSDLATELVGSALNGVGQFCTSPGLVFTIDGPDHPALRAALAGAIESAPLGTLLGPRIVDGLSEAAGRWSAAGARIIAEGPARSGPACTRPNTIMEVTGEAFLTEPDTLQTEAFGNLSLVVVCSDPDQLLRCIERLEGNLSGSIYSATDGSDDDAYRRVAPVLRSRVGRLLNDKVTTGVAVVPAMNHGGPYPATGHPGFTAVGIPASLERFAMLQCFDAVRDDRLPPELQAANPLGMLRWVDGEPTTDPVTWGR